MQDYLDPQWHSLLQDQGLHEFSAWWQRELPWFEPPNRRDDAWSGVATVMLPGDRLVFVKRQLNYTRRHVLTPWRRYNTLHREFKNIRRCERLGVPVPQAVFFGERRDAQGSKAVLVTAALTGFQPLTDWALTWQRQGWPRERRQVLADLAKLLRRLHGLGLQYTVCYPKHIFMRWHQGAPEFRLIDLEALRYQPLHALARWRDLDSLNRRSDLWSLRDKLYFFKQYLGVGKLNSWQRRLWRRLARRYDEKVGRLCPQ